MKIREAQEISNKIIQVLADERKRQKISRYRVAKDLGMSKSSITNIETFEQRPTTTTLILIVNYLQLTISEVMKRAGV